MTPWDNADGKLIVDGTGKPVECADCPCAAQCCVETREVTIAGLQGALSLLNGTYTLPIIVPGEYDGVSCCYSLFVPLGAEDVEPFSCGVYDGLGTEITLCVYDDGSFSLFIINSPPLNVAYWNYLGLGTQHTYHTCDPLTAVDGTAGFLVTLTPNDMTEPCP